MTIFYPIAFIGSMLTGLVFMLISITQLDMSDERFFSMGFFSKFDNKINENNIMRDVSINSVGLMNYALFNQGKSQVVIGNDNWLFTSEEFYSQDYSSNVLQNNLLAIEHVDTILKEKNIHLVVVPVPSKARVYQSKLTHLTPSPIHTQLYSNLIDFNIKNNICVVDSLRVFKSMQEDSFLKFDTHWSAQATEVLSKHIHNQIQSDHPGLLTPTDQAFVQHSSTSVQVKGDLTVFVPLPSWIKKDKTYDSVNVVSTYDTSMNEEDLFSDDQGVASQIALIGTSYSANQTFNFLSNLTLNFNSQITDYSEQAVGPFVPMVSFLNDKDSHENIKLVIWEIPERYLIKAYDTEVTYIYDYPLNFEKLENSYVRNQQ